MPELPEVEATRDNLARWTLEAGALIEVAVRDPRLAVEVGALVGRRVLGVRRRGKQLALDLARPRARRAEVTLATHLGMTGRWVRLGDADRERPHQRLVLAFARVSLALVDVRRFGDAHTLPPDVDAFRGLGPDAFDEPLDAAGLRAALGRGRTALKARLLEQRRVAGLGNIAVIEACHRARVHPHTPMDEVPARAFAALPDAVAAHLVKTLDECRGRDEIAYVSEGAPSPFLVYGREGEPCPRCGRAPITKVSLARRPTYYCARCQPLGS